MESDQVNIDVNQTPGWSFVVHSLV